MRKRITALALFLLLVLTLAGCGKSEAVKETERLINEIGTVTVDSVTAVEAAEAAYNALNKDERDQVSNAAALTAARKALDEALLEAQFLSLMGTWETQVDVRNDIIAEMDAQFSGAERSFSEYLDDCVMSLQLELGEDGIYRLSFGPTSLEEARQTIRVAAGDYITDYFLHYIAAELEKSGIKGDFSTRDGIEAAMGIKLEELIQSSFHVDMEVYIDQIANEIDPVKLLPNLQGEGKFTVRFNRDNHADQTAAADYSLLFSDTEEMEPENSTGAEFSLVDNVLTVDVSEESGFPLTGAWTFTRTDE